MFCDKYVQRNINVFLFSPLAEIGRNHVFRGGSFTRVVILEKYRIYVLHAKVRRTGTKLQARVYSVACPRRGFRVEARLETVNIIYV